MRLPIAALFATTALIPAAFAQNNSIVVADIPDGQICERLSTYVAENDTADTGMTPERAKAVVTGNDPKICRDAMTIAVGDTKNVEAEATARVQVAVPQPQVQVDQRAPQVSVDQPQPDVNVTPGRPVVTVNQAQPTVHVVTTPPTVTIDMPKPEILVEIPNPSVDVAMAEPRVSVSQPEPTVRVTQGEVKLELGDEKVVAPKTDEAAKVNVSQENATVRVSEAKAANINVAEVKPEVRFNAAEPRVEVEETGKANVKFNQSGDANVRFRQMSEEETRSAAARQGRPDEAQTASADATPAMTGNRPAADKPETASTPQDAEAKMAANTTAKDASASVDVKRQSVSVEELMNKSLIGASGDSIGDVENIVDRGGKTFVVIGVGGLLGIGEKQVAIPLEEITYRDDELFASSLTEEGVKQLAQYTPDSGRVLTSDQTVELVIQ